MADDKPSKPFPPRWAMIYMLVLTLAAIVWIILAACTGIRPGIAIGDCEIPRMTGRSGTQRARGLPGCGSLPDRESGLIAQVSVVKLGYLCRVQMTRWPSLSSSPWIRWHPSGYSRWRAAR
jgi:hypothetical protein